MVARPRSARFRRYAALITPVAAFGCIVAGFVLHHSDPDAGNRLWRVGLGVTGLPVTFRTVRGILRGQFASDIVASLAIVTAFLIGSAFPGLIVVLMQTGGEALERFAEGRASAAVRELEAKAPTVAHRFTNGVTEDIPVDDIKRGDALLVRPGDLIPCDAVVLRGHSSVDASRLTGEALPLDAKPGTRLMSGSSNGNGSLTVTALEPARESQYARIVELVRTAQSSKSPFQRLADRYAVWFTPLTLAVCALTYAVSSDWQRVLAVLVVATPCPLILAVPVAILGGINRAADRMIVFRTGAAVEELGGVTTGVFDKTGTLTIGRPQVTAVIPASGFESAELLRLASGVEEHASHPMARTLVEATLERGLMAPDAFDIEEVPGQGVKGRVEGQTVAVGGRGWIRREHPAAANDLDRLVNGGPGLHAYVTIDGRAAGVVTYQDKMRPGIANLVRQLRALGLSPLILLSGDHEQNTDAVARSIGFDAAEGDLLPGDKADRVSALMRQGRRVVMLGDGTNDAPALSTANVGVALASGGGGISAEAADVVLLDSQPGRLVDAIHISRDTLRIARQSVWAGLGLSMIAMGFAAGGMIAPAAGALLQEAIDVAVILNALRASRSPAPRGS
jgi:heavy metal translocating P-type ATPase